MLVLTQEMQDVLGNMAEQEQRLKDATATSAQVEQHLSELDKDLQLLHSQVQTL